MQRLNILKRILYKPLCTSKSAVLDETELRRICRKRKERIDSVTIDIVQERLQYQERIAEFQAAEDNIKRLEKDGFGRRRKLPTMYSQIYSSGNKISNTTAGGFVQFLAAASRNWPIFPHMLPEIAFAGHSNCGKSTLVNAMVGLSPHKGAASVSDRAGWTDQICFYMVGKKPPVMTLADLPGYGHAVASVVDKRQWTLMTRDYLSSRRVLSKCCVLVDCTRGICEEDHKMLRFLAKVGTPWQIILTKGDLLTVEQLAQSIEAVKQDVAQYCSAEGAQPATVIPVSSSTGAGVQKLWRELKKVVDVNARQAPPGSVREHFNAALLKSLASSAPR